MFQNTKCWINVAIFQACCNPSYKERSLSLISPKGDVKNPNWFVIIVGPSDLKGKVVFYSNKPLKEKLNKS